MNFERNSKLRIAFEGDGMEKDKLLISHLRANARDPLTKIAKRTNIPISTLFDRLKEGEKEYIVKHTTLLDFNKLGYHCRANIILKVKREDRCPVKSYLVEHDNVNSVFKINNGYDYLIDVVFSHVKDLEDFLEEFQSKFPIVNHVVHYIIEELAQEKFLSLKTQFS